MDSKQIINTELGSAIVGKIISEISKKYKINSFDPTSLVENLIIGNTNLLKLIEKNETQKRIEKSKYFKEVLSLSKKKTYYSLRQYSRDAELQEKLLIDLEEIGKSEIYPHPNYHSLIQELAKTHVSTKERLEDYEVFFENFFKNFDSYNSIVDIGCGINPIRFPFHLEEKCPELYLAIEKDLSSTKVLRTFSETIPKSPLKVIDWNIQDGWKVVRNDFPKSFDIALMFKLIPVVQRSNPDLLEVLIDTPAEYWMVSGSRFSMTKKESIEKRERKIIQNFIKMSGKKIIDEFSISEEFFYVLH